MMRPPQTKESNSCGIMLGHAHSEQVAEKFQEMFQNLDLPIAHLLSQSSDGPNMNKNIANKMESYLKLCGLPSYDLGTCLHIVYSNVRKGFSKFGAHVEELAIDIFY